jgi:nucleoid DNA-binding protein
MARDERHHSRTKADLIDRVYDRHGGLTKSEAAEVVETIFSTVKSALVEGRPVRIKNFGVWEVRPRPRRRGVNPASGEEIIIGPSKSLNFRPARLLKTLVAPCNDEKSS